MHKPSEEQIACHAPKPILLDTGEVRKNARWMTIEYIQRVTIKNVNLWQITGKRQSILASIGANGLWCRKKNIHHDSIWPLYSCYHWCKHLKPWLWYSNPGYVNTDLKQTWMSYHARRSMRSCFRSSTQYFRCGVGGVRSRPTPLHAYTHAPGPWRSVFVPQINLPYAWHPHIMDTQVGLVGQLAILPVPGEFTTMCGRRFREQVRAKLLLLLMMMLLLFQHLR